VKYLLDTGVWIWSLGAVEHLNQKASELISEGAHELFFSAASAWEISIKMAIGKLRLPESPISFVPNRLSTQRIQNLPITNTHALAVYALPKHHDDPFDRLLIAQARAEGMVVLTADKMFRKYNIDLFWCGR